MACCIGKRRDVSTFALTFCPRWTRSGKPLMVKSIVEKDEEWKLNFYNARKGRLQLTDGVILVNK